MTQIWRYLRIAAALVLLIVGAILAPTPIPIGWALILIGLSILVHESKTVRNHMRRLRERYPAFGRWLNRAKHHAPGFARRVIELTEPVRHPRRPAKAVVRIDDGPPAPPPAD